MKCWRGQGCVRDSVVCQSRSLIGHWNLQDFDSYGLWPGGGVGPGCLIKRLRCSRPLCVGSLILLSVNCHSKYLLPCPHPSLHPDRLGLWAQRKGWPASLRLPPIHHLSNHLIRAVFDDECTEWRWAWETHGVAHLYLLLIGSRTMREPNYTVYWAFVLLHVAQGTSCLSKSSLCIAKYSVKWCSISVQPQWNMVNVFACWTSGPW